jgi:hypothetical protein
MLATAGSATALAVKRRSRRRQILMAFLFFAILLFVDG